MRFLLRSLFQKVSKMLDGELSLQEEPGHGGGAAPGGAGGCPGPFVCQCVSSPERFRGQRPAARTEGARVGRQEPPGRGRTGSPIALGPSLSLSRSRREAVALQIRKAAVLCHIRAKV